VLQEEYREKRWSPVIKKFKQKKLKDLFENGKSAKIGKNLQDRILLILDILHGACTPEDANFPGSRFHGLKGDLKGFYSVSVSGNWRIIFRFENGNAYDVELIDYH